MNPENLPKNLIPLKKYLIEIQNISKKMGLLIAELALNFVYSNSFVDKIILGVETEKQLASNINMIKNWDNSNNRKVSNLINSISVSEKKLLNPSNWT